MSERGKDRFILTKSYEIAYALFRIAGTMDHKDFSERLRAGAGSLLESAAIEDHPAGRQALQVIECFAKFAGDVNLMNPANTDALLREVYVLDAALVEMMNAAKKTDLNLAEIFSASSPAIPPSESDAVAEPFQERVDDISNAAVSMKAEMRQSAILDRIRQYGNCRMKDIQEILPDASERTIRYDLQSLMERNLIERIGNGGPSVTYRIRQDAGVGATPQG